ncbi:MAG: sporulation protein [Ruminococcus sp.]|nr:sporulation protein [Ruminococcus sp.]
MKVKKSKKITATVMSGLLAFAAVANSIDAADISAGESEETTASSTVTEAVNETETSTSDEELVPADEAALAQAEAELEKNEEQDWQKADISDYDSSMSLVSYEVTTPEMLAAEAGEAETEKELTEEEKAEIKAKKETLRKASPMLTDKTKKITPTAVQVYSSGGYVGDVPPPQDAPTIETRPGEFAFVTYGWGHGVGMSQNGANFYATYSGWTYQDILFHYYPGTYLMNTGLTEVEELTIAHQPAGDTLDVVSQIVFAEVGGTMSYEAIKAQAVAVYTYIKYNGDDSSDLRGKPNPPQIVIDACAEVLGEALYYNEEYALTMFSASSGGISANCYEVFYQDVPYLRSVPSDYDAAYDPHYGTVTYIPADTIKNHIESRYGITLSDDPVNWIVPVYSEETGYATDVLLDGQMYVKAYAFSLAMGLKSSKFYLTYSY